MRVFFLHLNLISVSLRRISKRESSNRNLHRISCGSKGNRWPVPANTTAITTCSCVLDSSEPAHERRGWVTLQLCLPLFSAFGQEDMRDGNPQVSTSFCLIYRVLTVKLGMLIHFNSHSPLALLDYAKSGWKLYVSNSPEMVLYITRPAVLLVVQVSMYYFLLLVSDMSKYHNKTQLFIFCTMEEQISRCMFCYFGQRKMVWYVIVSLCVQMFRQVFDEGLELQKAHLREQRTCAKEQRREHARKHKDEIEAMENYYKDQVNLFLQFLHIGWVGNWPLYSFPELCPKWHTIHYALTLCSVYFTI